MSFLHKKIRDDSFLFGSDLKDLRALHQIDFEEACRETRIDPTILRAFEEDRIEDIRDPIFAKRHLLAYVKYLGGYEPYFAFRYQSYLDEHHQSERDVKELLPKERSVRFLDLFVAPQFLTFLGVLVLALFFGGYVFWQAYLVNSEPPLIIYSPDDGVRLDRPRVHVEGETMPEATVLINDREAPVDEEGGFALDLDLRRGTTVITITARRRRGSETTIERRVVFGEELLNPGALLDRGENGVEGSLSATSTSSTADIVSGESR